MRLQDGYAFENATAAGVSDVYSNNNGESLTVQVTTSASSFSLAAEGKAGYKATDEYTALCGINESTFATTETVTAAGIYVFPVDGMTNFRFNLSAVSGGEISVYFVTTKGE